jgi:very-short-patch-repair endonuclease
MNIIILILLFFVLIIAITLAKKFFKTSVELKTLPYKKKDYLLSVAEKEFYNILRIIVEKNNYLLFAKVRLEDLLWIPKHTDNRVGLRNRIKSRHVDFVICDKVDIRPLLVIELDDSSHEREDRKIRDEFVNQVLRGAGLPILHHKFQNFYSPREIEDKISNLLTIN